MAVGDVLPTSRLVEKMAAWHHRAGRGTANVVPLPGGRPEDDGTYAPVTPVPRPRGRPRRAVYDEDREVLLAFVRDFGREFHDVAPLSSSVTRAYNLLKRSGLSRDVFLDQMYQSRALVKERVASVRSQAGRDASGLPVKAQMAFFFAVLEQRLGLADTLGAPTNPD